MQIVLRENIHAIVQEKNVTTDDFIEIIPQNQPVSKEVEWKDNIVKEKENSEAMDKDIKQKISENEVQFMNLNTKITENEAKLQRSENLLSSSIATVNSKDLRIVEYKNQVDVQLDSMSKLERDKKEAQKQLDDMTYQNSSMNADIKLLRNNMNETELELSKTKSNLENIQRDMQREMNLLEERHKTIFSKLTSDRDQEILFLKSESSTLKTTHINEINRLAQEREELIRFQEKEYQTTIDLLKKKLEAALDYNQDLQVKHKGDINEKLEGIRQSTSNEVLNTKTKFSVMVDMLRENLAEVTSKLNETESKLTQRDTTLKMLEIENVKKSFEQKQLQDDYALSKENSIRSEESHYLTLKNIQRDLEDKSSKLLKASELAEELTNIKQTLQASMEIMKSENLQLIEKFSNSTLISREYKEKAEIEIQGLQKQVLNFEKIVHESKLLIETLENREKSSLETIESLKSNIQDIKELSESSKIGSIASSQGIKELEECLANLNSTFETKCKEVENLESLLSNKNAEIKLREDTNTKLDIKIENLEKKLVDSLEDCIKFKSDIEHLREESFKSISEEQECHKKLFKAQKKKHAQIIAELGGKAVVESNLLKETHQQIVQKLDQDYQNTLTELNAKTNEYDQLYHSYTFLQKEHKGLETLYLDLQVREHGIVVDLESKVQLLLQMKKKLKNIEVENQIQSGKLSTLIQDLDESKLQFVSIQSQHHSLLLREQKVELELDYSKKTIFDMEQKILELNKTRDEYLTLQVNFEEKSRVLAKSESQGATFQRLIAKQTKMVASLQITLLEMSKVVSMELPWTIEDVLHLPDKIKLCFKSSKETIPFELLDSNILLELVNRVRDGFIEREDFLAEIELQVKKINDLELANTNAISQLKNASLAITSIEKRTTSERNIEIGELEESQLKIVDLEKNLEKSLFERQKFEKALQKLRQDYDIALKEKELVEQDFVNVYENYQNSKAIFLEKTNAINVDSTILVEDNSKAILKLEEQRLEIEELSYTCQTLSKEKDGLYKQKMDLEKQLKACRVEIRDFGTRLSTLILDKEKLEEQLQFDENVPITQKKPVGEKNILLEIKENFKTLNVDSIQIIPPKSEELDKKEEIPIEKLDLKDTVAEKLIGHPFEIALEVKIEDAAVIRKDVVHDPKKEDLVKHFEKISKVDVELPTETKAVGMVKDMMKNHIEDSFDSITVDIKRDVTVIKTDLVDPQSNKVDTVKSEDIIVPKQTPDVPPPIYSEETIDRITAELFGAIFSDVLNEAKILSVLDTQLGAGLPDTSRVQRTKIESSVTIPEKTSTVTAKPVGLQLDLTKLPPLPLTIQNVAPSLPLTPSPKTVLPPTFNEQIEKGLDYVLTRFKNSLVENVYTIAPNIPESVILGLPFEAFPGVKELILETLKESVAEQFEKFQAYEKENNDLKRKIVLKPKPITKEDLVRESRKKIELWNGYNAKHDDDLDPLLTQTVRKVGKEYFDLDEDEAFVKNRLVNLIWEELLVDTTEGLNSIYNK